MIRHWKPLLLTGAYAVGLFLLFANALEHLRSRWNSADFDYCYLVLPVVGYLIWEKRAQLKRAPRVTNWWGLALLLMGIGLFWLGELGGEFFTLFIALWCSVVGLCLLHFGWPIMKILRFPIGLSLAIFPPPNWVAFNLSLQLRLLSSKIGVLLMQAMGMTAYREGNVIDLGFARLQVVDACSGLRYLFPIVILGLILAYFLKGQWWKKVLLVLSSIPLVVFANGVRIAVTGFLYQFWGPMVAEGFFHDFAGWFTFIFALGVLLPEMYLLKRIPPKHIERTACPTGADDSAPVPVSGAGHRRLPPALISLSLLLLTILLARGVEFRERIPIKQSLSAFPLTVAHWQGVRTAMEQPFVEALHFSDYALIDYRDAEGRMINVYVVYYDSQRKGASIHSPSSCLPGGGWVFNESGVATIDLEPDPRRTLQVNRAFIEKGAIRQLTYYWFPQRGRQLTGLLEMKFFAFWDALTRRRTDGALIRLITPVAQNESVEQADRRLQEMTRRLLPLLDRFIPGEDA